MVRNLGITWLQVLVIAICLGNVVCKPAIKNLNSNIQEVSSVNEDSSTDDADLTKTEENDTEEAFANETVNEDSPIRRPGSTDPEEETIDSGNNTAGEVFFDAADWVKEAEQWTFKGGDWGLVTLPNDKHPDIPTPPVPGPVLIAEGNSMSKVIVSRSEENLENLTLHFSYFLSHNPENPPVLEVYQIQDDTHSERVPVEATYGEWTTSTIPLPYSGNFEIKFIGQRIVDSNEIVLDDIVLRGLYMKDEDHDDDEEYDTQSTEEGEQDVNNAQFDTEGDQGVYNNTLSSEENNATQTVEEDVKDVNSDDGTSEDVIQDVDNDAQTAEEGDQDVDTNKQASDEGDITDSNDIQDTDENEQVVDNETQSDDENNEEKDKQGTDEYYEEVNENENDSSSDNEVDWNDLYDDVYSGDEYYDTNYTYYENGNGWFFNNWLNNNDDDKDDDSNSSDDPEESVDSIDTNEVSEIFEEIEDSGAGGGMIIFWVLSLSAVVLLGFLYWRRRGNDERTIFNRATAGQNDFDRLMYTDVPYEDDGSTGKNYNSFEK